MTNIKARTEMVKGLGFNKDVIDVVISELNKKNTKVNAQILNQINVSSYYQILVTDTKFTIHSTYHVNKYEINKIAKILGLDYVDCGTLIDDNGLWLEWVKLAG